MKRSFSFLAGMFGTSSTSAATATPPAVPTSGPETRLPERQHIVPIIKPRAWLNESRLAVPPFDFVTEDLNSELVVVYVADESKNLRYLSVPQLAEMRLTRQDVRPLALENLMRLLPQIRLHSGPLVSMLTAGGNYEASLLLVKDFWGGGKVQVAGEIVVAVPSRDVVLITGSHNPEGLVQLRKLALASRPAKPSFQLTHTLFVCRNGEFVPFDAHADTHASPLA